MATKAVRGVGRKDLTGLRNGKLVGVKESHKKGKDWMWLCNCDCGGQKIISANNLKNGSTKSCGCIRPITHYSSQPYYNTWIGMIGRCYKPNNKDYHNYGARGIRVCDEWLNSYPEFAKWMEKNGARKGLTLDRYPDNNGHYSPENCRLATAKQQCNNQRVNVYITKDGVTKTITEWAEFLGISLHAIRHRIRDGWDEEKTLSTPVRKKIKNYGNRRNKKIKNGG
jgi:hypothetical protein